MLYFITKEGRIFQVSLLPLPIYSSPIFITTYFPFSLFSTYYFLLPTFFFFTLSFHLSRLFLILPSCLSAITGFVVVKNPFRYWSIQNTEHIRIHETRALINMVTYTQNLYRCNRQQEKHHYIIYTRVIQMVGKYAAVCLQISIQHPAWPPLGSNFEH